MERRDEASNGIEKQLQYALPNDFKTETAKGEEKCSYLFGVHGEIKLASAPHYGLVLDVGSDVVPIVPVDCARHLPNWVSSIGQKVVIHRLLAVCSEVQILKEKKSSKHQNYFIKWEDVRILNEDEVQSRNDLKVNNNVFETKENTNKTKTVDAKPIIDSENTYHILVHHVAVPFHVGEGPSAACLVFISYTNMHYIETKLWLVLQDEQVSWREFLVPYREYLLQLPPGTNKFFLDESQKPLDQVMENNIRELSVIFHHKTIFDKFSIMNGSTIPTGSKMYLYQNTSLSVDVYKYTSQSLWFRFWFSTSEADYARVPLVTFYGRVASVMYLDETVYKSCYMCKEERPDQPALSTPKTLISHVWMNPFGNGLKLEENKVLELPSTSNEGNTRMETGVPGELVQVVKMQDLKTCEERCIYTKHSYVNSCQQMARLAIGVCMSVSHLIRRRSAKGNCYYISTMLSSYRVLDYEERTSQRN